MLKVCTVKGSKLNDSRLIDDKHTCTEVYGKISSFSRSIHPKIRPGDSGEAIERLDFKGLSSRPPTHKHKF